MTESRDTSSSLTDWEIWRSALLHGLPVTALVLALALWPGEMAAQWSGKLI